MTRKCHHFEVFFFFFLIYLCLHHIFRVICFKKLAKGHMWLLLSGIVKYVDIIFIILFFVIFITSRWLPTSLVNRFKSSFGSTCASPSLCHRVCFVKFLHWSPSWIDVKVCLWFISHLYSSVNSCWNLYLKVHGAETINYNLSIDNCWNFTCYFNLVITRIKTLNTLWVFYNFYFELIKFICFFISDYLHRNICNDVIINERNR